jgi:hypothetical protein
MYIPYLQATTLLPDIPRDPQTVPKVEQKHAHNPSVRDQPDVGARGDHYLCKKHPMLGGFDRIVD